jgi:nucleoside-triphosphatase THEP1
LLIIDEIGPLEFVEHQGLNNTLDVLRRARAYLSIITLRPSLAEVAREELSEIKVSIQILDESNRESIPKMLLNQLLERTSDAKETSS